MGCLTAPCNYISVIMVGQVRGNGKTVMWILNILIGQDSSPPPPPPPTPLLLWFSKASS